MDRRTKSERERGGVRTRAVATGGGGKRTRNSCRSGTTFGRVSPHRGPHARPVSARIRRSVVLRLRLRTNVRHEPLDTVNTEHVQCFLRLCLSLSLSLRIYVRASASVLCIHRPVAAITRPWSCTCVRDTCISLSVSVCLFRFVPRSFLSSRAGESHVLGRD